jgi:hypothetical protein
MAYGLSNGMYEDNIYLDKEIKESKEEEESRVEHFQVLVACVYNPSTQEARRA